MMKYFLLFASLIFFAACNSGAGKSEKSDSADASTVLQNVGGTAVDSANMSGSNLIAANDCFTCHQIDKKNIGPSYRQIANRYENNQGNIENLAHKIIHGGKGLWGNNAMTPHSEVTNTQAEMMAAYILSLRDTTK